MKSKVYILLIIGFLVTSFSRYGYASENPAAAPIVLQSTVLAEILSGVKSSAEATGQANNAISPNEVQVPPPIPIAASVIAPQPGNEPITTENINAGIKSQTISMTPEPNLTVSKNIVSKFVSDNVSPESSSQKAEVSDEQLTFAARQQEKQQPEMLRYDFDCQNTKLSDTIFVIAKRAGKNISINGKLEGSVLTSMFQKTFEEALDILAKTFNFNWMVEGDTVLVSPGDTMLQSKRFIIKHANTKLIKDELISLNIEEKRININSEYNAISVMATPYTLAMVEKRIHEIDIPVLQCLIVAKLVEISKSDGLDLGFKYTMPSMTQKVTRDTGVMENKVEMTYSVVNSANKSIGKGRVISKPFVMTLNGQAATVEMGDKVPVLDSTSTTTSTQVTVRYEPIGSIMKVTPILNNIDKVVTLSVDTQMSTISKWVTTGPVSAPQISTRRAVTTAHLKSGDTMIIGGLMNSSEMDNLSGIPGLMNLPILGNLFKYSSKSRDNSEIVIMLTPYIIDEKLNTQEIIKKQ